MFTMFNNTCITASEVNKGKLIELLEKGKTVYIIKNNKVIGVALSPEEYKRLTDK